MVMDESFQVGQTVDLAVELSRPLSWRRVLLARLMTGMTLGLAMLAMLPLGAILFEIVRRGFPQFSFQRLVLLPAPVGAEGVIGGFGNAILGTFILVGLATLLTVPIGVTAALYLTEFGRRTKSATVLRFVANVLSGVPAIVVGVFAYAVVVLSTIWGYRGFSVLAGSFALAVLMLPIVILTAESALKLVPTNLRLASSALGCSQFQTIFRVVLPAAFPGILTGVLLAMARAAGETAPLIFTALFSQGWFQGVLNPVASLSVLIYNYAESPFVEQNKLAWTASLVLISVVLVVNIASRVVTRRKAD